MGSFHLGRYSHFAEMSAVFDYLSLLRPFMHVATAGQVRERGVFPFSCSLFNAGAMWAMSTQIYGDLTFTGSAIMSGQPSPSYNFLLPYTSGSQPTNRVNPGLPYSTLAFGHLTVNGSTIYCELVVLVPFSFLTPCSADQLCFQTGSII
jgi:hypothetical protein